MKSRPISFTLAVGLTIAVSGCATTQSAKVSFQSEVRIQPPALTSLEITESSGNALSDGQTVRPGETLTVTARGSSGAEGELLAGGTTSSIQDNGAGVYSTRWTAPDVDDRTSLDLAFRLRDDLATPRYSDTVTRSIVVAPEVMAGPDPAELALEREYERLKSILDSSRVYFPFSRSDLDSDSYTTIAAWAEQMRGAPKSFVFALNGACDEIGDDTTNEQLGLARAVAVKEALINMNIDGTRISTKSLGESKASSCEELPSDNVAECRANDRIVFVTIER